jgi:uncharacterized protein (UPF0548 family)
VISPVRPSQKRIEAYSEARSAAEPTHPSAAGVQEGFRRDRFTRNVGHGVDDFARASAGLASWVGHRSAEVEVFPADAGLEPGVTVTLLLRQLRLWVLAACRIESVIDETDTFGFVYATMPGHPVHGYESFVIQRGSNDLVRFEIEAVSRPASPLTRLASPVSKALQRQLTNRYLDGVQRFVANGS